MPCPALRYELLHLGSALICSGHYNLLQGIYREPVARSNNYLLETLVPEMQAGTPEM